MQLILKWPSVKFSPSVLIVLLLNIHSKQVRGRAVTNVVKTYCQIPLYIYLYFILSSEIMEIISAIKVVSIYSEMIWYHFTVD